jgi:diguanylate cyclase (GGDEF)-like protein
MMAESDRIGPRSGTVQTGQPTLGDDDLLRAALEASGDVAYAWDFGSDVMTWSSNVQQAFNLDSGTHIATRTEFICRVNGEDLSALARVQDGRYEAGESYQVEYRLRGDDGTFSWVQDRGVVQGGNGGQSLRAVGTIRVITERKNNEAHLEWLTNFDEVTGHYNRMRLRELLDHAFAYAARYDSPGAYLSVAIDDLAVISDAYGREVADRAVIAVGLALDKCLRGADVVGRVSPDQFGIVISNCPESVLPTVCEKVLDAVLHATVAVTGGALQLTASVGSVSFPQTVHASHDAVIKADVALAHARRSGQNCFMVYNLTEEQRGSRRRTLAIAKEIQTALQTDGLQLAFQPIVRGDTHEVVFYECLLRITGEEGLLPTGPALHVAESMGMIRLIDRRVLSMAVRELEADPDVMLAINISGLTTTDPSWLRNLIALIGDRPDMAGAWWSRSPRQRCSTIWKRPCGLFRRSASAVAAWRWTILAPAIPRSAISRPWRSTSSRSTAPS